jgi:predicted dinucleotide-binding enzyme
MEIGTIGAGAFAQAFAKQALKAGHKVKLSSHHGPDSLREVVAQLGPGSGWNTKAKTTTKYNTHSQCSVLPRDSMKASWAVTIQLYIASQMEDALLPTPLRTNVPQARRQRSR